MSREKRPTIAGVVRSLVLFGPVWAAFCVPSASAQLRSSVIWNRTLMFYSINRFTLLDRPAIRKELKIDKDQRRKLTEALNRRDRLRREYWKNAAARGVLPPAAQKEAYKAEQEFLRKTEAAANRSIDTILSRQQLGRLSQMKIQMMGIFWALQDHEFAAKLRISEAQQQQFQKIYVAKVEKRRKLLAGIRGDKVERDEYEHQVAKLKREIERLTLAVLTAEQKAQSVKLKGKPFDTRAAEVMVGPVAGEFDRLKLLVDGREAINDELLVLPVGKPFTIKGQYHMTETYKGRPMTALIIKFEGTWRLGGQSTGGTARLIGKRTLEFSGVVPKLHQPGEYLLKVYGPTSGPSSKIIMQTKVLAK